MSLNAAPRRTASRTRLAVAAIVLPLAFGSVLSGCSAGQITQTAQKRPGVAGSQATVGDLKVVNAFITAPSSDKYESGDIAELEMLVSSMGPADELVSVSVDGTDATISSSDSEASSSSSVEIPADGSAYFSSSKAGVATIEVTMPKEAYPATLIPVTLTFQDAGEVTFDVAVAGSLEEIPRDDEQKWTPSEGAEHG